MNTNPLSPLELEAFNTAKSTYTKPSFTLKAQLFVLIGGALFTFVLGLSNLGKFQLEQYLLTFGMSAFFTFLAFIMNTLAQKKSLELSTVQPEMLKKVHGTLEHKVFRSKNDPTNFVVINDEVKTHLIGKWMLHSDFDGKMTTVYYAYDHIFVISSQSECCCEG